LIMTDFILMQRDGDIAGSMRSLAECHHPTVALIEGACVGGGLLAASQYDPRPLSAEEAAGSCAGFDTEDFPIGTRAFLAKAKPRFTGRGRVYTCPKNQTLTLP